MFHLFVLVIKIKKWKIRKGKRLSISRKYREKWFYCKLLVMPANDLFFILVVVCTIGKKALFYLAIIQNLSK